MATSFGTTGGPHRTQDFASRSDTGFPAVVKDLPERSNDDYVPWIQDAAQTHEPEDVLEIEGEYDLDTEEDYHSDAEDDTVEDMEIRLLWLWYRNLLRNVLASIIICYPVIFRSWEFASAYHLRTRAMFEHEENLVDDLLYMIAMPIPLSIVTVRVGVGVISVAEDPWRFRRKVWAMMDLL